MKFVFFSASLLASGIAAAATPVNGWYSSIFGGYAHLSEKVSKTILGLTFSETLSSDGFNAGLRLGYQANPVRFEVEYTYIQPENKEFDFGLLELERKTNANVGMGNIYFDFSDGILPTIYPFIGAGIGYAYVHTKITDTGPIGGTFVDVKKGVFAYQGTAGLTFNFEENWALNASYRYLATSDADHVEKYQAQMGDVGIVYRFDYCNYK
ncbi:outer membrane beta-barrel protein [Fluoribacter dumoffii]|uniref:Opacity protein and related surface antigens n=1 Tax=Fluoribacter dumoffii TaxID=463 RepID=A0A377G7I9_9GAMM|nr:outer membrane beta-barrel protein [Fluoribacter dumoffii]KTC89675.1 opacity protein-like surface antigen [Fluoribacter dumoffii NY 23]MCW8384869.1 outer membrane beta-barrel protein [Fluoribacter dumoffii]MCW8417931.1 outer membrane beta-barrel protein [Fluoribacter dumoffii]MCW8454227.1 outer membrane beta-barrel protein [Fluoribacter dumoffii]MCW8461699.1 outer membrane beta-barrel protein [Fluoribacter dumoffii]